MIQRNRSLAAGVGIACALSGWLLVGSAAVPGTKSSGSPADADYCNILLVPSLAAKIGLDLPTRIRVAKRGARLLCFLRNGSGHMPVLHGPEEVAQKNGSRALARAGKEARSMLPSKARESFEALYSDGELVRVGFSMQPSKKNAPAGAKRFVVYYGWYAEEKQRAKPKSLRALEDRLDDCYLWIPDAGVADEFLEHEHKDVRRAAEKWLRKSEEGPLPQPTAADVQDDVRQVSENNARLREEARVQAEERARRAEEFRERQDARREEFRAKQEEFRRKLEERRREER